MDDSYIWAKLSEGEQDLTDLSDSELTLIWRRSLEQLAHLEGHARVPLVQTEILRRNLNFSSGEAKTLAKFAVVIATLATIGTLANLIVACIQLKQ
jgi:hypothetical protein